MSQLRLWCLLGLTCLLSRQAFGQVPGESLPILDRLIVRVVESGNPQATAEAFVAAFHADPANAGTTLAIADSVPGQNLFLLIIATTPGVTPRVTDLDETHPTLVAAAEFLCECDSPEGGTGSTYVSSPALAAVDFSQQFASSTLDLNTAHAVSAGRNVVVAVLDTGLDTTHQGFAGRVLPWGRSFIGAPDDIADVGDGVDGDGDGLVDEMTGHGTYVAGLVSLVAPDAKILPIRVLNDEGIGDSWTVTAGIYYAIDRGVEVINLSLRSTLESEEMERALDAAKDLGIVVVAAAGNFDRSEPTEYPAMDHPVLGVAAVDDNDLKATFSNFDNSLFICAPGTTAELGGNPSAPDATQSIISLFPGDQYGFWEGTSMSTPLVAGAAAVIRSQHPEWAANGDTVDAVKDALAGSAVDIDTLNPDYVGLLGVGRLHVGNAVALGPASPSLGDLDGDGTVNVGDLIRLITDWAETHTPADLNGDGVVNITDLLTLLQSWG